MMDSRWHNKITGTFWCRLYQNRSLYFYKILSVEICSRLLRHLMTELQTFPYRIPTQIQVPVFHSQLVTAICVIFNGEWRKFSGIKHTQLRYFYFDFAGCYFIIF